MNSSRLSACRRGTGGFGGSQRRRNHGPGICHSTTERSTNEGRGNEMAKHRTLILNTDINVYRGDRLRPYRSSQSALPAVKRLLPVPPTDRTLSLHRTPPTVEPPLAYNPNNPMWWKRQNAVTQSNPLFDRSLKPCTNPRKIRR